jgi:hypothetical protein
VISRTLRPNSEWAKSTVYPSRCAIAATTAARVEDSPPVWCRATRFRRAMELTTPLRHEVPFGVHGVTLRSSIRAAIKRPEYALTPVRIAVLGLESSKRDAELPGGDQIEFLPTNEKQRGHIRPTVQHLYQCPRTSNSRYDNILVAVIRTFGGLFRSGIGPPPPWSFRSPPHHGQPDRCGINTPTVLE